MSSPCLNQDLGFSQTLEDLHPDRSQPFFQGDSDELGAIVGPNMCRGSMNYEQLGQDRLHVHTFDLTCNKKGKIFPARLINDRKFRILAIIMIANIDEFICLSSVRSETARRRRAFSLSKSFKPVFPLLAHFGRSERCVWSHQINRALSSMVRTLLLRRDRRMSALPRLAIKSSLTGLSNIAAKY